MTSLTTSYVAARSSPVNKLPPASTARPGGDGDFFHTSEAKTSLLDIAVNALLTPKER